MILRELAMQSDMATHVKDSRAKAYRMINDHMANKERDSCHCCCIDEYTQCHSHNRNPCLDSPPHLAVTSPSGHEHCVTRVSY